MRRENREVPAQPQVEQVLKQDALGRVELVRVGALPCVRRVASGSSLLLSRRVARRPPKQLDKELTQDRYLFNYSGLDRYSRLGLYFRVIDESFHYDGAAYRRILKSYPRSQAAQTASERLEEIEEENHKGTKITKSR